MSGYFKLRRKLLEDPMWLSEPFTRGQAWADLIGIANYKDGFIRIRGVRIDVLRGQVGWSEESLAQRWQWSRGKVRRFLQELEEVEGNIVQQKSNVKSLISIVNYNKHQIDSTTDDTADDTPNGTTNGQQTDTKKKNNTVKKENIYIPACKEIIEYLNEKSGKAFKSNSIKTKSCIIARLNEGYGIDDFKKVVDIKCDEWLNSDMDKYIRPETLFGSRFDSYKNQKLTVKQQPEQQPYNPASADRVTKMTSTLFKH